MLYYMSNPTTPIPATAITDLLKANVSSAGKDDYWSDAKAMVQLQGDLGGYRALLAGNSEHYDFGVYYPAENEVRSFSHEASHLIGIALAKQS